MTPSILRWLLLLAAAAAGARCVFFGTTPPFLVLTAAAGLLWFWLSRRKVRSLDRDTLGVPPRRLDK
jgi:hypothetical protein